MSSSFDVDELAARTSKLIRKCRDTEKFPVIKKIDDEAWVTATLPLRMRGFGLRDHTAIALCLSPVSPTSLVKKAPTKHTSVCSLHLQLRTCHHLLTPATNARQAKKAKNECRTVQGCWPNCAGRDCFAFVAKLTRGVS